ncbi:MAG: electron transfer flavoprotein subunit beta/FixA family protein [bacterium]|nr:electron transfer flavoprotein subunit beta/FixA family protein [bacterium]
MYQIIVLVKQVPDTRDITTKTMKEDGTVNRTALPAIFNPEDLNALEAALLIKEKYGAIVTVITMGPPSAAEILRESLYRGADKVILLTDRRFAGSDTLATSYILSMAIKRIEKFDIIFTGRQAIDGDTAQVGPQVAEKLNIPQITYMQEVLHLNKNEIKIKRLIDNGIEVLKSKLPVLITVNNTSNTPRFPSIKQMAKFKKAISNSELTKVSNTLKYLSPERYSEETLIQNRLLINEWNMEDINANPILCGISGSPTKVFKINYVTLETKETKEIPPNEKGIKTLIQELIKEHIV